MSFTRKIRSNSLTESSQRALTLNQAADRILEQQISNYKREEKQLQKRLDNLRRTRATLDAGMKLILPQTRSRSLTEPRSPRLSDRPGRNPSFSAHASGKLPVIMTSSPTPSRRFAISKEDPLQWCKTTLGEQASHQGNLLSVPEKQCLLRTHSNEDLRKTSEFNILTEAAAQNDIIQQRPLLSSPILRAKEGKEGQSLSAGEVRKSTGVHKMRERSFSEADCLRFLLPDERDNTGSFLSPPSYLPAASKSPKPHLKRSSSMFALQKSFKTNAELMTTVQLSGKFKTVGQYALGMAVISRLNGLEAEDLGIGKFNASGYHETGRRSQTEMNTAHNQFIRPRLANNKSLIMSRKNCWKKEENPPQEDCQSAYSTQSK